MKAETIIDSRPGRSANRNTAAKYKATSSSTEGTTYITARNEDEWRRELLLTAASDIDIISMDTTERGLSPKKAARVQDLTRVILSLMTADDRPLEEMADLLFGAHNWEVAGESGLTPETSYV